MVFPQQPGSQPLPSSPEAAVRAMQIIWFALVMGVAIFLAIVVFQRLPGAGAPVHDPPIITYVGLAMSVSNIVLVIFMGQMMAAAFRRRVRDEAKGAAAGGLPVTWYVAYQTRLIVRLALLEGVAFLWCIAHMMEGHTLDLPMALLFLAGIVWQMPTRARVDSWLEAQRDAALQEASA